MKTIIKLTAIYTLLAATTVSSLKSSGTMFKNHKPSAGILTTISISGHANHEALSCIRKYNPEKDAYATIKNLQSTKLDHLFKPDAHEVFVYEDAQGLKGVCTFQATGKTAMLHIISVKLGCQKKGIGSALLYAAGNYLKNDLGTTHLQLIAEESAKKFYTKSGFGPIGADTAEHMMIGKLS